MDDLTGQVIKGYEIRQKAGMGSFGAVYRAYQPSVGREVAIKVIQPTYANQPEFIRRFEIEARLVARLEHPFIVPLFDYWREPDGAYLVMRWIPRSLGNTMHGSPMKLPVIWRVMDQVAAALAVAHRSGVIHRDLKPDNVLLDEQENAYLTDFGIAVQLDHPDEQQDNTVSGTMAYAAPEQLLGQPVTPQSDIYSLGILLYEMVAGKYPFSFVTPLELLQKQIETSLPNVVASRPDVPPQVNLIIQRATAKDAADRYADVLDFAADLRHALNPEAASLTEEPAYILLNPYKGLRSFELADAPDFFGRETLVRQLIARLNETGPLARFLAVVGPSGSGKSSVVNAGLLPALQQGTLRDGVLQYTAGIVPGDNPFQALTAALVSLASNPDLDAAALLNSGDDGMTAAIDSALPEGELLLVVDQFEELFTLVDSKAARVRFLKLLHSAVIHPQSRLRVVIILRADFYDQPLLYEGFGDLFQERTQVVLPLSAAEIGRAIAGPAERCGLQVDSKLLATIVDEVRDAPGMLPLLQYALTEVFERREGRKLTLDAYLKSGGVSGALARRAEELYSTLDAEQQRIVRHVFLRLVTLGEGTEDTRRRIAWSELTSLVGNHPTLSAVLESFGRYRLLTFDHDRLTREPTVEVAHEALIREWNRLREWLDGSRADLRLEQRLASSTAEWLRGGRDTSFLLRGSQFAQYEDWVAETDLALTQDEHAFLEASAAERRLREQAEQERLAREKALERQSRNRLRGLVIVLTMATLIAIILTFITFTQRDAASAARATSDANAALSQSLALASAAQAAMSDGDTDAALAFSLEAVRRNPDLAQAQTVLAEAGYAPGTRRLFSGHTGQIYTVAISPDGRQALSGATDNTVILWDLATGQIIYRLTGHTAPINKVVFSPNGTMAVSASHDDTLILWDLASGSLIRQFGVHGEGHTDLVRGVSFSPDGRTFVSSSQDRTLILWDMATGNVIRRMGADGSGHTGPVYSVAFSPDGRTILSGSDDTTLILWDAQTGEKLRTFVGHTAAIDTVEFSLDGKTALSASDDGTMILWDVATGNELHPFIGHKSIVTDAVFSPDDTEVLSSSYDKTIILWDTATGNIIRQYSGHRDRVFAVAFSPDGQTFLSGSEDTRLRLWDIAIGNEIHHFQGGHTAPVMSLSLSPDGQTFLSGSQDHTIIQWNVATGDLIRRYGSDGSGHTDWVTSAIFTPDQRQIFSAAEDKTMLLWDAASGGILRRFEPGTGYVYDAALSADGRSALIASRYGASLWTLSSGERVRIMPRYNGFSGEMFTAALSPDGTMALTGSQDSYIILWDLTTIERVGQPIRNFVGHGATINSLAFSPDGKTALSGSADATMISWDVATGQILHRFVGHTAGINSVAFSPDGRFGLSTSLDNAAILWDLATGERLRRYEGFPDGVNKAIFTADGRAALFAEGDGTISLRRIDSRDELITWTYANRYVPDLGCDQRQLYRLTPCDTDGNIPTPVPFETSVPTLAATPASPVAKISGSPTPTITPNPIQVARLGENHGVILMGDHELWTYDGKAGEVISIAVNADSPARAMADFHAGLDTEVVLRAPDGTLLIQNNDSELGATTNSLINGQTLPVDGTYQIEVRSWGFVTQGGYTLVIEPGLVVTPEATPSEPPVEATSEATPG